MLMKLHKQVGMLETKSRGSPNAWLRLALGCFQSLARTDIKTQLKGGMGAEHL